MDLRFEKLWEAAIKSISDDMPNDGELFDRIPENLEFDECDGISAGGDVQEMLAALRRAANEIDIAKNLHLVSEFCEVTQLLY
mgnify:CR=1 FL=1